MLRRRFGLLVLKLEEVAAKKSKWFLLYSYLRN